jgi:hypothetical protein
VRSPPLISILVAATTGACSQSLVPNMSGTGGAATAPGGATGGATPGTGGFGGSVAPGCSELAAQYQAALPAAETCHVGASGQCQQAVTASLPFGCACPTYVTDSSELTTITQAWQAAGCQGATPPCALVDCSAPNTTCVSVDGGSLGFCSYVPSFGTGAAGASGVGGTGGGGGVGGSAVDGGPGPAEAILYPSSDIAGVYVLAVSNVPISCDNTIPTMPCRPPVVTYLVQLLIPAADLTPGTYSVSDLFSSGFSEEQPNSGGLDCSFGGGSLGGSLKIASASSGSLVFGLQVSSADFDLDEVSLTAQRCAGAVDAAP